MNNLLLDLPMWLVGVIIVTAWAALGVGLVLLVHRFVRRHHHEEHNQVISDGFAAVGTVYAIIAGLLVFGVFTTFDEASTESANEASNLVLMYRDAQSFPQPYRDQAQQSVIAYINSVINDEWPALADGEGSPATGRALDRLFAVYDPITPENSWSDQYTDSVADLREVSKLRDQRIDDSRASLPPIYWFLLVLGGVITVLYLSLSYVESRAFHAVAVGLMGAMMGLVIFLLVEVNLPFRGEIALSPEAFENALVTISEIDPVTK